MNSVVCIYAIADDLRFLRPVVNSIARLAASGIAVHELEDRASHVRASAALKNARDGLAIVFAHGTEDCIRGGERRNRSTGEIVATEKFLTRDDLGAFSGKAVICLSCQSNGLAARCLDAGAIAFVGFDEIPFRLFDGAGAEIAAPIVVKHCQRLIADAMKAMLRVFLGGGCALDSAVNYLRLWVDRHAVDYVRRMNSVKERGEIAALFLRFGHGARYYGPRGLMFG